MNGYLIDTNILSELRRARRSEVVVRWFDSIGADEIFLSVLSLGEIRHGIETLRLRDPKAAEAIEGWLVAMEGQFHDRIVPVDQAIVDQWGRLGVREPLPVIDGLLAATALVYDFTIASRNTRDFEKSGAKIVNPFDFAV